MWRSSRRSVRGVLTDIENGEIWDFGTGHSAQARRVARLPAADRVDDE
jgi:hypothetical protein